MKEDYPKTFNELLTHKRVSKISDGENTYYRVTSLMRVLELNEDSSRHYARQITDENKRQIKARLSAKTEYTGMVWFLNEAGLLELWNYIHKEKKDPRYESPLCKEQKKEAQEIKEREKEDEKEKQLAVLHAIIKSDNIRMVRKGGVIYYCIPDICVFCGKQKKFLRVYSKKDKIMFKNVLYISEEGLRKSANKLV